MNDDHDDIKDRLLKAKRHISNAENLINERDRKRDPLLYELRQIHTRLDNIHDSSRTPNT